MKKTIVIILSMLYGLGLQAQVILGVRDTRYLQAGYQFAKGAYVTLEQSVYSENYRYQKMRLYAGYTHKWDNLMLDANIYGSTLWAGGYQDAGALLKGEYHIFRLWAVDATLNPHYDTGINYQTCYSIGTSVNVNKDVALTAKYSTIPEFRESERCLRVGAQFKVANLLVHPEISIPADGKVKTVRMLCSMRYVFSR